MTTFNFRLDKNVKDIAGQAVDIVGATIGTRPDLEGSHITVVDEPDGDTVKVALDFAPNNVAVRSGTVGVSRGTMRGAR